MSRHNTNLLETLWEEAIFGIAVVNKEGTLIDANPKLCDILGYPRNGLIGLSFRDITHPADYEMDQTEFTRLLAGEIDKYGMFKRYITKSGELIGLKLKVVAVRDDGNLELILGQVSEALKIIPMDEAQIKRAASVTLGQFLIEHWKVVGIFIGVIALGSRLPDIIKAFL